MWDGMISEGIHAHSVAMVIIIQPGNLPFKRQGLSKQRERRRYGIKHHFHNWRKENPHCCCCGEAGNRARQPPCCTAAAAVESQSDASQSETRRHFHTGVHPDDILTSSAVLPRHRQGVPATVPSLEWDFLSEPDSFICVTLLQIKKKGLNNSSAH